MSYNANNWFRKDNKIPSSPNQLRPLASLLAGVLQELRLTCVLGASLEPAASAQEGCLG